MRAIGKNVLVTKEEAESTTAGGIIYTDNTRVTPARVVAIGDEITSVAVNDELVINWGSTIPLKVKDTTYHIVHIDNVFAVL